MAISGIASHLVSKMNELSDSEQRAVIAAVSSIADQLSTTIDDDFDLHVDVDIEHDQVLKLVMMINFVLDRVRRNIDRLTSIQHELEERVRERTAELNLILEGSNDGVWVWYFDAEKLVCSRRWLEMIGSPPTPSGAPEFWFDRVHPRDLPRLRTAIAAHLDGLDAFLSVEYRIRHTNGTYRWMLCRGLAERDAQGRVGLLAGTQSDITALRSVDAGSGLPNERSFREAIEDALCDGVGGTVALIAFNRLGDLVEALDHQTIEALRIETRLRLLQRLPPRTFLAQLPGTQFGVILPAEETGPEAILAGVCRAFDQPAQIDHSSFDWLGLSIGAVDLSQHPMVGVDDVLANCWLALRVARSRPDRELCWFEAEMRQDAARAMAVEKAVRRAVAEQRVVPFFQPIVATDSGRLRGFEALARLRDEQGEWVSPAVFIPVIERSELINAVGRIMLEQSLRHLAEWRAAGWAEEQLFVSVNVAARQLLDPQFPGTVHAALGECAVPPSCLKLEVTETSLMENIDEAVAVLTALRESGVRISLDDFGTGYSSLEYIQRLPLDVLKIDRSFVQKIEACADTRAIVSTVCSLAHLLGLEVVAEGVETRAEESILAGLLVPMIQGFYYSRPLPPEVIDGALLSRLKEVAA